MAELGIKTNDSPLLIPKFLARRPVRRLLFTLNWLRSKFNRQVPTPQCCGNRTPGLGVRLRRVSRYCARPPFW
jgi:hypothetical protein